MQDSSTSAQRTWIDAYRAEGLRRSLARFTRDEAAAEDLVQDAALRFVLALRSESPPENPAAWMRRVATNLALGRGRRMRVAARWLDTCRDDESSPSPETIVDARQRAAVVREALQGLSERDRALVLLAADGGSGDELAAADARSALATRSALCRARARLRAALDVG